MCKFSSILPAQEANSVEAIMRAVEAGLGAAFVSKSVAAAPLHAGRISILRLEVRALVFRAQGLREGSQPLKTICKI